jgi:MerR family transcriptional regulator, copper efflux regulator
MNIGEASKATGISVKMIRYYESIGLIPAALRTFSGYRVYGDREVETLRFIRRARDLGFLVEDIDRLIRLWRNSGRASAEVRKLALAHVSEIERKIADLQSMAGDLRQLADSCQGDESPDCAIIDHMRTLPSARRPALPSPRFDGVTILSDRMKPRAASAARR